MKHLVRALAWLLAITALTWLPPSSVAAGSSHAERARESVAWLVGQLDHDGQMPGPGGRSDTGLAIDVLWALHATGAGVEQADAIAQALRATTGDYLGADLFGRAEARLAAQTAKLLVAVVVAGEDPTGFGTGRFLAPGESYDLRAETLALVTPDGPRAGRVANTGTGRDDSNVFGQAFAVIGLARSGGVPDSVVGYLAAQQCTGGWFRMFLNDDLTCDAANGAQDGDGTALGIQALMVAGAHGHDGLDEAINRGLDWLVSVQQPDGSFAGGTATATGNANSTGLVVQTLVAGAQRTTGARAERLRSAVARAQEWITSVHVHAANPAAARLVEDGEIGAIAYDRPALTSAAAHGIGVGARDQWRRSTAQAVLALAPVSMADLGTGQFDEELEPTVPTPRPDPAPTPAPTPGPRPTKTPALDSSPAPPVPAPPTSDPDPLPRHASPDTLPDRTPRTGNSPVGRAAGSPTQRLEEHLLAHLIHGTHVRSTVDGVEYVDHHLTVDVLLALYALDTDIQVLARVTRFLARPAQVSAYAFGAPYEDDAAYAAPLARLSVALRLGEGIGAYGPVVRRSLQRVDAALASLPSDDGVRSDRGEHPDPRTDTGRQAWITIALTAAEHPDAEVARAALTDAQCVDGTFPRDLATTCDHGDVHATALTLAVLSSAPAVGDAQLDSGEVRALAQSARTVSSTLHTAADPGRNTPSLGDLADLTVATHTLGMGPARPSPAVLAAQLADGSFTDGASDLALDAAMAPVLSGRTWLDAPSSPVRSALAPGWHLTTQELSGTDTSTGAHATVTAALAGASGLLAGVGLAVLGAGARSRRSPHQSAPSTLTTGVTR